MKLSKTSKLWLVLILILSVTFVFAGCGGGGGDKAATTDKGPIVAKFTHVVAAETTKGRIIQYFADTVAKKSNGRMKIDVFASGQLYGDAEEMEALVANNAQFIAPSSTKVVALDPGFQIFDLMFLFPTEDSVAKFFKDPKGGKQMMARLENKGLVGIGFLPSGFKQWYNSKHPINSVADMKGVKFRAAAGGILTEQYAAMGSSSVSIPFGEVYSALQLKTVDGSENNWANIFSQNYFEVGPYITYSDHGRFDYSVLSNKKFMDSLPADLRKIVEDSWMEAQDYGVSIIVKEEEDFKNKIIATGKVTINKLTPEQRAEFKKAVEPVWDKWRSKIGEDIFERALESGK